MPIAVPLVDTAAAARGSRPHGVTDHSQT